MSATETQELAAKAGRPRAIKIAAIRIDGQTQVRLAISEATVAEYAEAMGRGEKLPALLVVWDGAEHWLADGFHRLHAYRQRGWDTVPCQIVNGTRTDAVWLATGANRANGLRMTTADKEQAVKLALAARPQKSNSEIARHVGVSDMTVAKYRRELESTSQIGKLETRTGADGRERPASQPRRAAQSPAGEAAARAAAVPPPPEPMDARDIPPPAGDQPPPSVDIPPPPTTDPRGSDAPPPPIVQATDKLGAPIYGRIAAAFARECELTELAGAVSRVKKAVGDAIAAGDPLFADVTAAAFEADCANVRRWLENAKPYAVCPYCGGDGCQACKDRGWVNRMTYDVAPPRTEGQP